MSDDKKLINRLRDCAHLAVDEHNSHFQDFRADLDQWRIEDHIYWKAADAIERLAAERDAAWDAGRDAAAEFVQQYFGGDDRCAASHPRPRNLEAGVGGIKIDGKEWKLVPVEVTAKMAQAHFRAFATASTISAEGSAVWAAMIAAAPSPNIEELVEKCARAMAIERAPKMSPDDLTLELSGKQKAWWKFFEADARAVLRHLFGDEK